MASTGKNRRIVSITSAPGWAALLEQADDPLEEPRLVTLAAWALVDEGGGQTRMVGLVQKPQDEGSPGTFGLADEQEGFAGYSNQGLKTKAAD